MRGTTPTLTLQDIADLARVRRSVVTMWRKRPTVRGERIPFPPPAHISNGVEHFDRNAIVDWLRRTGRGNNAEVDLDAPALSAPNDVDLEDLVTLLCLASTTGAELAETTPDQRQELAETVDHGDGFLLSEVNAQAPSRPTLAYVDDLVEASFGPAEALERLENGRPGRANATRDLTTDAVDLVRHIVQSCALHLDTEGVALVHSGAGDSTRLTFNLATDFRHLVVSGDAPQHRALRRRAAIRGIPVTAEPSSPQVHVLSTVGLASAAVLDRIDDLLLELPPSDLAVILGPAAVLCDNLRGKEEQDRAQTLRPGSLAVALRLPRGLWREAHRQALGLWVCTGDSARQRPLVADLAAVTKAELNLDDLTADVTAALAYAGSRAYGYLRLHNLTRILSSRFPIVPHGIRAPRLATRDATEHLRRINAATLVTSEPLSTFDILAEAAPGSMLLRRQSLGELRELKWVAVKRGSRIDPAHADRTGSVRVLSAKEGGELFLLDPFDAAKLYPRAARTEPGDVVFAEHPRPAAVVDDVGGSLVASPSRLLRIEPDTGFGPHATAALINLLPNEAGEWRTWNVPIVDAEFVGPLEDAVIAAAEHEARLRHHLAATNELVSAMIDGVAAGAVKLAAPTGQ